MYKSALGLPRSGTRQVRVSSEPFTTSWLLRTNVALPGKCHNLHPLTTVSVFPSSLSLHVSSSYLVDIGQYRTTDFCGCLCLDAICLYLHLKILLVLILPGGYRTTSSIGSDIGLGPAAFIPMQEKLPWKCLQTMMVRMIKRMVNE